MAPRLADHDEMVKRARRMLHRVQAQAMERVSALMKKPGEEGYDADADVAWKERPTRVAMAGMMAQAFVSEEKARVASDAPRSLGVVIITQQVQSGAEWERAAIEAQEVPRGLSQAEIQRASGPVGVVSGELGPGVSGKQGE